MRVATFTDFKNAIEHLCTIFHASETSGHRTKKRNELVGGVPDSQHLYGMAVDLVLDSPDNHGIFMQACAEMGLRAINEGDHIHVEVPR